jgi:salicylate hydroxylase
VNTHPILVAGAGIGALTFALAASRLGIETILIERRTKIEEIGAGIQLSPNASRILIQLGLGPALSRLSAEPERLHVRDGLTGTTLSSMPLGNAMREAYGAPYLTLHRADLQTILLDAIRGAANVRLAFGRRVTQFENTSSHLIVSTETSSGIETYHGSALVGADGLWSIIATCIGDQQKPRFSNNTAWRGTISRADWPTALPASETGLWLGPDAHIVHYPIRGGALMNIVAITADKTGEEGWNRPGDPALLQKRFEAWSPSVRNALSSVPEWQIWSLYDTPPRPHWSKGNVTLLGDAAHPVLPFLAQGAALAIEDAAILVREIIRSPHDLGRAFSAYETVRKPRAARVQAAAHQNASTFHATWPLSTARNFIMRRTDLMKRYAWLYGWHP